VVDAASPRQREQLFAQHHDVVGEPDRFELRVEPARQPPVWIVTYRKCPMTWKLRRMAWRRCIKAKTAAVTSAASKAVAVALEAPDD
jgi:hypothetical protein